MRAGLSTIQQTLTPEAAAVVNRSMAEAARRSHGQTTPLHVAATLLSAPSGLLRQACVRSHPTSSHPLQCRALDLCFSVALDRLPSTTTASAAAAVEPPISNALMAALKRAQAHQRRGCPEQQQQPLLAVKVELEQLVVSILDDPSVSRVMREASFSSPAVKSTIEQTLIPSPSASSDRSLYMNPRLQQPPTTATTSAAPAADFSEAKRVLEIMARQKKRNPVIVADSDPVAVMKEVLRRIESRDDSPPSLRAARIISLEDELGSDRSKIGELGSAIAGRIGDRGAILDLGDLKWLVESSGGCSGSGSGQIRQQIVSDAARASVAEIGKLLGRLCGGENRVWLVGAATCATYLRCQVYHPTMEADWDLQAVPISPRSPFPNLFPRLGCNGILSCSLESLAPIKGFQVPGSSPSPSPALQRQFPESLDLSRRTMTLCPMCVEGYQCELGKLTSKESEKPESGLALPRWLQLAKPDHLQSKEQELMKKQSADEMLKRWHNTCSRLHPKLRPPRAPLLSRNCNGSKPSLEIPVITELVLGHRTSPDGTPRKAHPDRINDLTGFIQNGISNKDGDRDSKSATNLSDFDSFKKLFKGLADKVGWQPEAASSIATIVMQCKSGNGKRGAAPKGDTWLFFSGSDVVGKRRMAAALSKLVFSAEPITVCLAGSPRADGQDEESGFSFRGKTSIDRVTEAVRRNPFSLVVLEGIDRADTFIKGSIKRAIERGRMLDSQGREVGLGSVIFVLISDWIPDELKTTQHSILECEERVLESVNCGWQLELSIDGNAGKRGADNADIIHHRPNKLRKEFGGSRLSLDLNLAAGIEEDEGQQLVEVEVEGEGEGEGSRNSSDLTVEHDHKSMRLAISSTTPSPSPDLIESVGDVIVFNPVDFAPLRRKTLDYISTKFATLRVDEDALNRIVGGVWLDGAGATGLFEDWAEKVLFPSLQHLKRNLNSGDGADFVRLSAVKQSKRQLTGEGWLPSTVAIAGDETGWAVEA